MGEAREEGELRGYVLPSGKRWRTPQLEGQNEKGEEGTHDS